jgi:outer membrane protein TolC
MADSRPKHFLARTTPDFIRAGRGAPAGALMALLALSLPVLAGFTPAPGAPQTTPGTARGTATAIAPTSPAARGTAPAPAPSSPVPAAKESPARETPKPSGSALPSDVTGAALGFEGLESDQERRARQAADEQYAGAPFPPAPRVIRVSLRQAVDSALQNNLDVLVERFNPLLLQKDVVSAKAVLYDPTFDANITRTNRNTPVASIFFPSGALNEKLTEYGFGLSQPTTIGGLVRAEIQTVRTLTNSPVEVLTDRFEPVLSLSISQELLRGFGWNVNRTRIRRSMIGQAVSVETLRNQVINSVFAVQQAYWALVGARENLKVQRLGLRLAEDLLRQNRIQVKVGTLAPIDELQAKAQTAAANTQVIAAENDVRQAQDVLLKLTTRDSELISEDIRVETTDTPTYQPRKVDFGENLRMALDRRPELKVSELNLQDKTLVKKAARNNVLPRATLNFATGLSGLSGDPNSTVTPFGGSPAVTLPVVGGGGGTVTIPGSSPTPAGLSVLGTPFASESSFSDATSTFFTRDQFSFWSVGLVISYPIGNRDARAQYSRSKLDVEKARTDVTRTEQSVTVDLKRAVDGLDALARAVESTREAREVAEEQLDAENKKLAVGLSTNFQVLQFQQDLTDRRREEVGALTRYKIGLANLDRATGTTLDTLNVDFIGE